MPAYSEDVAKFAALDAQVLGVSPDSIYSHLAWQRKEIGLLEFPLLSDYYPHAAVAIQYGILRLGAPLPGISERAIFIVDKAGKIAWAKDYPLGEVPDVQEVATALGQVK